MEKLIKDLSKVIRVMKNDDNIVLNKEQLKVLSRVNNYEMFRDLMGYVVFSNNLIYLESFCLLNDLDEVADVYEIFNEHQIDNIDDAKDLVEYYKTGKQSVSLRKYFKQNKVPANIDYNDIIKIEKEENTKAQKYIDILNTIENEGKRADFRAILCNMNIAFDDDLMYLIIEKLDEWDLNTAYRLFSTSFYRNHPAYAEIILNDGVQKEVDLLMPLYLDIDFISRFPDIITFSEFVNLDFKQLISLTSSLEAANYGKELLASYSNCQNGMQKYAIVPSDDDVKCISVDSHMFDEDRKEQLYNQTIKMIIEKTSVKKLVLK